MTESSARELLWNGLVLREFLEHFYETVRQLRGLLVDWSTQRRIPFVALDQAVRLHAFPLKENSHRLFRVAEGVAGDVEDEAISTGTVLDLTVSVLFHAVMRLKEHVYLINHYQPRLERLVRQPAALAREIETLNALIESVSRDLPDTVGAILALLDSAQEMLHRLLPIWTDTRMAVLFFCTHGQLMNSVYGPDGTDKAYSVMFRGSASAGWFVAGRLLWETGHYAQALDAFDRMAVLDRAEHSAIAAERRETVAALCTAFAKGRVPGIDEHVRRRASALVTNGSVARGGG